MRIYLDTNVLVSGIATRGLCADVLHVVLAEHQLIAGEVVLGELGRILRQKIRVPTGMIAEIDALLRQQALVVSDAPPLRVRIRDAADASILAEAVAGHADVLVTGDQDLLVIAAKAPLPIVTPRGLWELLRSNPDPK